MSLIDPSTTRAINILPARDDDASAASQQVLHGDCLAVLEGLPSGSIDAIVTSPPHNLGRRHGSHADDLPQGDYLSWMGEIAAGCARVLNRRGSLFLVLEAGPDPWRSLDVALQFRQHLTLQNRISWVKSITVGAESRGHYRPLRGKKYLNRTHADIYHYSHSGRVEIDRLALGVPYQDPANIRRWGTGADRRCGGNSWFVPHETRQGDWRHPTGYPVDLPRRCLRLHGAPGLVLDPFLGSGTTLVAARELGWQGIGVEIDADYAAMARARIDGDNAQSQAPENRKTFWRMLFGRDAASSKRAA